VMRFDNRDVKITFHPRNENYLLVNELNSFKRPRLIITAISP